MTRLLLPLCLILLFSCNVMGQKKKIIQRDSVWVSVTCDTIFGRIEYPVGLGSIKGDGIILRCTQWENHKKIPATPIDTTKIGFWISDGMAIGQPRPPYAMIKTSKGYVILDVKYIFTPN